MNMGPEATTCGKVFFVVNLLLISVNRGTKGNVHRKRKQTQEKITTNMNRTKTSPRTQKLKFTPTKISPENLQIYNKTSR